MTFWPAFWDALLAVGLAGSSVAVFAALFAWDDGELGAPAAVVLALAGSVAFAACLAGVVAVEGL